MTEEEHTKIVKELSKKYIGTKTPDGGIITDVYVDYRPNYQELNRVMDEWGNIYFIGELE